MIKFLQMTVEYTFTFTEKITYIWICVTFLNKKTIWLKFFFLSLLKVKN